MDGMDIELLLVPDCPHEQAAAELLTAALEDIGLGSAGFTVTMIDSQDEAEHRRFIGSPTFALDGSDVFAESGRPASITCRIYPGSGSLPELRDLRQALKRAAAVSVSR